MNFILSMLLLIIIILLVIGIIRVTTTPSNGFGDFMMHLLCIDLLIDLIVVIFEILGSLFEGLGD